MLSFVACLLLVGCTGDLFETTFPDDELIQRDPQFHKVTGSVEIAWKGNGGGQGEMTEDPRIFVDISAFEAIPGKPAKGDLKIETWRESVLHRQIEANVIDVFVAPSQAKAWFITEVVSDTKACAEHGGTGSGTHEEGGCDHDEGGGCEHEDGQDEGGHDDNCPGHESGSGGNGGLSGSQCRIGQFMAVKVHDVTTPATDGDGLAWKWFAPDDIGLLDISDVDSWPHLCRKTILAGNLVVH